MRTTARELIEHELQEAAPSLRMAPKDVPQGVRDWVKAATGVAMTRYDVIHDDDVEITIPWHEGARDYWQNFQLTADGVGAKPVGKMLVNSGMDGGDFRTTRVPVKSGFILVKATTGPVNKVIVYTAGDALQALPTAEIDLTDDELVALVTTMGLKSFARPRYPATVYQGLINKGLLKANKSLSVEGENYVRAHGKALRERWNRDELYDKAPESPSGRRLYDMDFPQSVR